MYSSSAWSLSRRQVNVLRPFYFERFGWIFPVISDYHENKKIKKSLIPLQIPPVLYFNGADAFREMSLTGHLVLTHPLYHLATHSCSQMQSAPASFRCFPCIHQCFLLFLVQVLQTSVSCPSVHRAWQRRARTTAPVSQMLLDPTSACVHMDSR